MGRSIDCKGLCIYWLGKPNRFHLQHGEKYMFWTALFYIAFLMIAQSEIKGVESSTVIVTQLGPLQVGSPLPSFNGQTSLGGRLSSRSLIGEGNVTVVSYAATWCQPCRYGMPIIERVVQADDGVQAVYVALDTEVMKVRKWAGEMDIQSPIIVDRFNAIAKRHGVVNEDAQQPREIPITIVVDAQGTIAQIFTTEGTDFEIRLRQAIHLAIQSSNQMQQAASQDPESTTTEQGGKQ